MALFKNISMLNENSWKAAGRESNKNNAEGFAAGHSIIKITPNFFYYDRERNNLNPIYGVMMEKLSLSIDSEWQEMGSMKFPLASSFIDKFSDASALAGSGDLGSVWLSKKLWRRNGDLKISPRFKIVDWDGTGRPLRFALDLVKYCVPGQTTISTELEKSINELRTDVEQGINTAGKATTDVLNSFKDLNDKKKNTGINLANQFVAGARKRATTVSNNIMDDLHDVITLKDAPPPVKVQIGQYFYHPDMVITSVSFDFSKEVSERGPLFVDVTLDVVTRKRVRGLKDVGFVEVGKMASRVDIRKRATPLSPAPTIPPVLEHTVGSDRNAARAEAIHQQSDAKEAARKLREETWVPEGELHNQGA